MAGANEIDELVSRVHQVEKSVDEVVQFYSKANLKVALQKNNKLIPSMKKMHQDGATKRMQDLMRQFGSIFRQITQHKWAWPFMQPVDVNGLKLSDYYQIIDRPMDFGTIKNQMEAKDGTGYKHVRDICSDVRLVFHNAMKYNEKKSEVYLMAKSLLEKFEEKWLQFLPKVAEEETRWEEEENEARAKSQLARMSSYAKLARDLDQELSNIDMRIEELHQKTAESCCREMSTLEKRRLGFDLARLCPEDLSNALGIIAKNNPNFDPETEEIELDLNSQSDPTLWRLKFFVKDALKNRSKRSLSNDDHDVAGGKTSRRRCNVESGSLVKKKKKFKPCS